MWSSNLQDVSGMLSNLQDVSGMLQCPNGNVGTGEGEEKHKDDNG
jgi:hypothetical protein